MAQALLGLGGNLGDVRSTLDRAVAALCDGREVQLVARSSDYRTPPWGVTDQPPFVNLAIMVETTLAPRALLDNALRVEALFGRDRTTEAVRRHILGNAQRIAYPLPLVADILRVAQRPHR